MIINDFDKKGKFCLVQYKLSIPLFFTTKSTKFYTKSTNFNKYHIAFP